MESGFWVLCVQNIQSHIKSVYIPFSPCFHAISYLQGCGGYRIGVEGTVYAISHEKWCWYDNAICIEEMANGSMRFYSNVPPLWPHLLLDKWKMCIDSTPYYRSTKVHLTSILGQFAYCWHTAKTVETMLFAFSPKRTVVVQTSSTLCTSNFQY